MLVTSSLTFPAGIELAAGLMYISPTSMPSVESAAGKTFFPVPDPVLSLTADDDPHPDSMTTCTMRMAQETAVKRDSLYMAGMPFRIDVLPATCQPAHERRLNGASTRHLMSRAVLLPQLAVVAHPRAARGRLDQLEAAVMQRRSQLLSVARDGHRHATPFERDDGEVVRDGHRRR